MQISPYAIPGVKKYKPVASKRYTPEELILTIKNTVLNFYKLPEHSVFSKRRDAELVLARNVMHYLAKSLTKLSVKNIGRIYPGESALDHTTVLHSLRKVRDYMETDEIFRAQVLDMKREIEGSGIELVRPIPTIPPGKPKRGKKTEPILPAPKLIITKAAQPSPVIRMQTLSESEKVMAKYL